MTNTSMGLQIKKMLKQGNTYPEIIKATGAAKSTIAYHSRKLGLAGANHNWKAIQDTYSAGATVYEIMSDFGIHRSTMWKAVKEGQLILDPEREERERKRSIPNVLIFVENSPFDSTLVRKRVIRDHLLPYVCAVEDCPVHIKAEWRGLPLSLHLDHKNGQRNDHRLSNLRWLCPSCHSLTPTYAGRNKKNGAP